MSFPSFATGEVLTAADMNAVGLWLVKSQTIGTGVPSVTVTNAFSSDYENYRIVISGVTGSAAIELRFNFVGLTTNNYNNGVFTVTSGATNNPSANNLPYWYIGNPTTHTGNSSSFDVFRPFDTSFRKTLVGNFYGNNVSGFIGGQTSLTGSFTDFTLSLSSGTITGGTIRVYGYRS
jgi:hypothetical protein